MSKRLASCAGPLPCAIAEHLLAEMQFFGSDDVLRVSTDSNWANALTDRAELTSIGQRARRIAEERFSFDAMAARYEESYRDTLEKKTP